MIHKTIIKSIFLSIVATSTLLTPTQSQAQEAFLGQIIWVGFNFCPRGFADANGQLLSISSNSALFSLYGTIYGGDGRTTFALPDLRGRSPVHAGQGPGLSDIRQGQRSGNEDVTLTENQMPSHTHTSTLHVTDATGDSDSPDDNILASHRRSGIYSTGTANKTMDASSIAGGSTGNNQSIGIRSPYLAIRACAALIGIYPSRN